MIEPKCVKKRENIFVYSLSVTLPLTRYSATHQQRGFYLFFIYFMCDVFRIVRYFYFSVPNLLCDGLF